MAPIALRLADYKFCENLIYVFCLKTTHVSPDGSSIIHVVALYSFTVKATGRGGLAAFGNAMATCPARLGAPEPPWKWR